jgi:hypothetical protein
MGGERVFLYHAHGYALGGRIEQPVQRELDSHAATTLSIVGGYATSKSGPYYLDKLISYESAHTIISGIRNEEGTHSTSVDTVIQGLNILDIITADKVVGRLSAKHEDGQPAKIIPLGSGFENLRIAGVPVDVEMANDLFSHHSTHEDLHAHFQGKCGANDPCAAFKPLNSGRYEWGHPPGKMPEKLRKQMIVPADTGWKESGGHLHCSIVRQVKETNLSGPKVTIPYGNAICIPQVGRLYLGELSSDGDTKRLTMLRLELGSPVVGTVAAAGPQTNGKWFP